MFIFRYLSMSNGRLFRLASVFKLLAEEIYIPPYRNVAKTFHMIMNRLKDSQGPDDDGFVESVDPVKEINPSQFQFQAAVWRDPEAEMDGSKFPGLAKLVKHLSHYLGRPKEETDHSVAWETIEAGKDPIRISIIAYNAGSSETSSLKVSIGPLRSDFL